MDNKKIGQFISKQRIEKNMTPKQLAEILGTSEQEISKWENGSCLPKDSVLISLCKNLDISIQELLLAKEINDNEMKEETTLLITQLMKNQDQNEDTDTKMFAKFLVFFILLPIVIYILTSYDSETIIDNNLSLSLFTPFIFTLSIFKGIECIVNHKDYFKWFCFGSLSLFITLYFVLVQSTI